MMLTKEQIEELFPEIRYIQSNSLRLKVFATWVNAIKQGGWESIDHIPFTLYYPTSVTLIQHTRQVTRMAIAIAKLWEELAPGMIHMDTLIAGGLLHDVGKLLEYHETTDNITFKPGALRHHFSGEQLAREQGLTKEVLNCIAHHGYESNPKQRIPESTIIHHCDFICFEIEQKRDD